MKSYVYVLLVLFSSNVFAAESKKEERKPAEFEGDVRVLTQQVKSGLDRYLLIQIVDKSNKTICYGKVGPNSSAISCTPMP